MEDQAATGTSLLSGSSLTGHINEDESNTRENHSCVRGRLDTSQPVLSNISSSPAFFPQFSKLPSEIRCQIWLKSVSDHRVLPIIYKRDSFSYVPRIGPPAVLQVNRESRHEGLSIYHELRLGPVPAQHCYVDLTRDIVYLKTDVQNNDAVLNNRETLGSRGRLMDLPRRPGLNPLPPTRRSALFEDDAQDVDESLIVRRHSKVIFHDLLSSADGQAMLGNLHVDVRTWSLIHRYHYYWRHRLPAGVELKRLVFVHERGNGVLRDVVELLPVKCLPAHYKNDSVAIRQVHSFTASNRYLNNRDLKNGHAPMLNYTVAAKSLERGEREFEGASPSVGSLQI